MTIPILGIDVSKKDLSYAGLKKALFEYNTIFKSTHVLNLIDNIVLRKAIRTARNRTEAYHQLQGLRKIYRGGFFKGRKMHSDNYKIKNGTKLSKTNSTYTLGLLTDATEPVI